MNYTPQIIALYLPQYHRIPENDRFWGEGFTDWVTVKNAKSLFDGHQQPRVPLNDNYYDLSLKENVAWQAQLAKEYGIDGFGVYHYWFNNEQNLLTKPAEIIRDNDDIDINYFFVWDNGNWIRSWSNVAGNDWAPIAEKKDTHNGPQILLRYVLGRESDWEKHYEYVATHFRKDKYIKIDGKPVFCIYNSSPEIYEMCEYWDQLAKNDGFNGMLFLFNSLRATNDCKYLKYNYEPQAAGLENTFIQKIEKRLRKLFHIEDNIKIYDYDKIWNNLLKNAKANKDQSLFAFGAFTGYDDTPRRGKTRGKVVLGGTPEKFERYFSELCQISANQGKKFIFLSAWNEWGEGMFLEPDTIHKFAYLNAVKTALTK